MIKDAVLAASMACLAVSPPVMANTERKSQPIRQVAIANRTATVEPAAQGFVNAVQVYPFVEGTIYQGYTAPGSVTDIALQPAEAIVAVASGDTARRGIRDTTRGTGETTRQPILVNTFAAGLSKNLVLMRNRRSYHVRVYHPARPTMAA